MSETGLMRGKRGLIMGVANNRSIAWGIAKAARQHGADLAFTYQGDALRKRVEPLAEEVDGLVVGHVAVSPMTVASGPPGAGIGPVAVVASHRRQGIAAELMRAAFRACPAAGFGWAVVLGDPAYLRPIRVPPRLRVRPVGRIPRWFGVSGDRAGARHVAAERRVGSLCAGVRVARVMSPIIPLPPPRPSSPHGRRVA